MKRKRKIGVWIFIAVVMLLLAGVGGSIIFGVSWLHSQLASDEPRLALSRVVSRFLGVKGEFVALDVNLRGATSPGFSGKGANLIATIRADEISASVNVSELLNRTWSVPRIDIAHLSLMARPDRSLKSESETASFARSPQETGNGDEQWYQQWFPNRFHLAALSIEDFDLTWEQAGSKGAFLNARVDAEPRGMSWLIHARRAQLHASDALTFSVPSLRILWSRHRTEIENMELAHGGRATFQLSGIASPELDLKLMAEQVELGDWIPRSVNQYLSGNFNANAKITQPAKKEINAVGSINFNHARLREHPAMIKVATHTRMSQYRDLTFQVARGDFTAAGSRVDIRKLEIESRGLLRMEGYGTINGNTIDAEVDVGVPVAALRFLPGAGSQVFDRKAGGYHWARVKIQGPLANPDQDLVSRLINAPFTMVLSGLGGTLTDTLPDAAVATAGGATQIIKGGLGLVGGAAKTMTTGKTEGLKNGATDIIQGTGSLLNIFNPFKSRGKEEKTPLESP